MIFFDEKYQSFHLRTRRTSYIISIGSKGHPMGLYYGPRLGSETPGENLLPSCHLGQANQTNYSSEPPLFNLETTRLEYSGPGKGDYRDPSCILVSADGDRTFDFTYKTHRIFHDKPVLAGLPYAQVDESNTDDTTLEIELEDPVTGLRVVLGYSLIADCDIISRQVRMINDSERVVFMEKIASFCLDLDGTDWELTTLDGAWIRERHVHRRILGPGKTEVSSRKGSSSSDHSPFLALSRRGRHYGAALVYSGSHTCSVELSPHGIARMQMGVQSEGFRWMLGPGEVFQTPEAVLTFSPDGMNGLSANFHALVNRHIIPVYWRRKPRPILVNNWEATFFDFNENKLLSIAKEAARAGVELFVLDDGWFGERNDETTSLGDWFVNKAKLPGGLERLSQKIRAVGLDFGLWVEPEMISENSHLHRDHPDWMIRAPGRSPSPGRHQFLLDMANPEVRDHLFDVLSAVFREAEVSYVKWDMNRNFSDMYSPSLPPERQGEFAHRYILGLYDLLSRIVEAFPHVLFESCAAGGNRFDLGMLSFMPQVWTSDNTDAAERLDIQEGTSHFAPPSTMGAHLSAVPNYQVLRRTPFETRFNVAAFGILGFELDLTALTPFERKVMMKQIAFYKANRDVLQFGRFYRLHHPEEPNGRAWMTVSENASRAVLGVYQKLAAANPGSMRINLAGLDPDRLYAVETRVQYVDLHELGHLASRALPVTMDEHSSAFDAVADRYMLPTEDFRVTAKGDELMIAGLRLPQRFHGGGYDETVVLTGDFFSRLYTIEEL